MGNSMGNQKNVIISVFFAACHSRFGLSARLGSIFRELLECFMGTTTRILSIGTVKIGGGLPVVLQSMTATKTTEIEKTAETCQRLTDAGAGIVRVAVDTPRDAEAMREIR